VEGTKHHGLSRNRLPREPLEKLFADEWEKIAPTTLGHLLCGQDSCRHEYSQRDATVAATIVQWIGSPVGSDFVRGILERGSK
jgi:hypothetical protein